MYSTQPQATRLAMIKFNKDYYALLSDTPMGLQTTPKERAVLKQVGNNSFLARKMDSSDEKNVMIRFSPVLGANSSDPYLKKGTNYIMKFKTDTSMTPANITKFTGDLGEIRELTTPSTYGIAGYNTTYKTRIRFSPTIKSTNNASEYIYTNEDVIMYGDVTDDTIDLPDIAFDYNTNGDGTIAAYSTSQPSTFTISFQEAPQPLFFISGQENVSVMDRCEGRIVKYIPISLGSTTNHMVEVNILGGVSVTWSMEPITPASETLVLYFFPQCDRRADFSFAWSISGTQ